MATFIKKIEADGKRVLILGTETKQAPNLAFSIRNIPTSSVQNGFEHQWLRRNFALAHHRARVSC